MKKIKKIFSLMAKIFAGEKIKKNTSLEQVMNNLVWEGWDLIKKGPENLTAEEAERMAVIANKTTNMVELFTACLEAEQDPEARQIINL
jgi:hypothetical protein